MRIPFDGPVIASRRNPRIEELRLLEDRRRREEVRLFRFDGVKLLAEALLRGVPLAAVYLRAGDAERLQARLEDLCAGAVPEIRCPVYGVEDSLFDRVSTERAPDGAIAVAPYLGIHRTGGPEAEGILPSSGPALLLESVRDPLNVGAVVRSAAALGARGLAVSADCADLYHPRAVRASMGALFSLPVSRAPDMAAFVRALRAAGWTVYAAVAAEGALTLGEDALERGGPSRRVAAVVGNEGHGLSDAVTAACDARLRVPMRSGVESLNAGTAAALLLWEMGRA